MKPRILVVEDDTNIRHAVVDELHAQGWDVSQAMDGELGLQLKFDCLVLDLMLPRIHGYEICKTIRMEGNTVPVLIMSALGEEQDVLAGFQVGATDYIRKPFSLAELVMRVKVQIKSAESTNLNFSGYSLEIETGILTAPDGSQAELTQKEKGVIICLAQKPGRVLTRQTLLSEVWGDSTATGDRSVDRCIKTLRKKLPDDSHLKTVRQVGYMWKE